MATNIIACSKILLVLITILQPLFSSHAFTTRSPTTRHNEVKRSRQLLPLRLSETTPDEVEDALSLLPATESTEDSATDVASSVSKRSMLRFALPALGIYLCNPLLSNIDNAFVGQTVGTKGLAALSPATLCTDQMLYLFSFLGRATTGIVSRSYKLNDDNDDGNVKHFTSARDAAAAPFTVALACGVLLTLFYGLFTPQLLGVLRVDPSLRSAASSYIYIRGSIAWAALAQAVCLSILMATRDAITPLKIVGLAAIVNVGGDFLLCSWPLRWGCAGASAATALATLVSSGFMVRALSIRKLLPDIKVPTRKELLELSEFMGPLLAITIARLFGFIAMQRTAMRLGVQDLAGYQVGINLLRFFMLFGEPLSQVSQTQLPALLDNQRSDKVKESLKAAMGLASFTALGVAAVAFVSAYFGSGFFTSDAGVQAITRATSPMLFMAVATAIFTVAVDGAMLASRDFGFMLVFGIGTLFVQLGLLPYCRSISHILGTFTFRLGSYAIAVLVRAALGFGGLGKALGNRSKAKAPIASHD